MKPATEVDVGPEGEAEWQRLRRQLELAEGFWLGFIFSSSPLTSEVFRRRTERIIQGQTRRLESFLPKNPASLQSVLPALFSANIASVGCAWLEALYIDPEEGALGTIRPWEDTWLELISRMNERRDALRRHLHGGLVLVAPPTMKPLFREAASDLWSIRGLVIEIPLVAEGAQRSGYSRQEPFSIVNESAKSTKDDALTEFTLAESKRLLAKTSSQTTNELDILFSRIDALTSSGRTGEAVEAARQARELASNDAHPKPLLQTIALQKLAQAESAHGDSAAAEEHLESALKILGDQHSIYRVQLLTELFDNFYQRGEFSSALAGYEEALALTRQLRVLIGETSSVIRALLICLNKVGDVQQRLGDIQAASTAYEELLDLARQCRASTGDTLETTHDLLASLQNLGNVRESLGDFTYASALYEELLALARQFRITSGDAPEAIRDLFVALQNTGDMHMLLGDFASANTTYSEALSLARQIHATSGKTFDALSILSVALTKSGHVQASLGNLSIAYSIYNESLSLNRYLRTSTGDTPRTLESLSAALDNVGDIQFRLGNHSAASNAYSESLFIRRQSFEVLGPVPEIVHGLGVSLDRLAKIQHSSGDIEAARASYEEALTFARKLYERMGSIPQTINNLKVSLRNASLIREELGDKAGAARAKEELNALLTQWPE